MSASARRRFQLVEYGAPIDLIGQLAHQANIDRDIAARLIAGAGERVAKSLRLSASPLLVEGGGIRAADFAGMIRLGPAWELEVAPKFLGKDEINSRWREDFYFLANLSRHGRLLASERLRASGRAPKDLASLIARSLTGMYWDNRRRPLRAYRRARIDDFFIEGEVDPVDLRFPGPDGFTQDVVRYDRNNQLNATILAAARALLPETGDTEASAGLLRVVQDLPAQRLLPARRSRSVPGRSRAWQPVIDLSNDVLDGFGLSYKEGFSSAPGYVLSTWRAWEDLLTIAVRLVYGSAAASAQKEYLLGTRTGMPAGITSNVRVYPDLIVNAANLPPFIIDAKYKTNAQKGAVRIVESDTFEAMAYAKASDCEHVVLAYPALASDASADLGSTFPFEIIKVGATHIYGVYVQVRGISQRGGIEKFGQGLKAGIQTMFANVESAKV